MAGYLDQRFKRFNSLSLCLSSSLTRSTFLSGSIYFPLCVSFAVSLSDTQKQTNIHPESSETSVLVLTLAPPPSGPLRKRFIIHSHGGMKRRSICCFCNLFLNTDHSGFHVKPVFVLHLSPCHTLAAFFGYSVIFFPCSFLL